MNRRAPALLLFTFVVMLFLAAFNISRAVLRPPAVECTPERYIYCRDPASSIERTFETIKLQTADGYLFSVWIVTPAAKAAEKQKLQNAIVFVSGFGEDRRQALRYMNWFKDRQLVATELTRQPGAEPCRGETCVRAFEVFNQWLFARTAGRRDFIVFADAAALFRKLSPTQQAAFDRYLFVGPCFEPARRLAAAVAGTPLPAALLEPLAAVFTRMYGETDWLQLPYSQRDWQAVVIGPAACALPAGLKADLTVKRASAGWFFQAGGAGLQSFIQSKTAL